MDLLRLNRLITQTQFTMETNQSVLCVIRSYDWMVSINLKDTCLYIPTLTNYFVSWHSVMSYQFRALCFGLHGNAGLH